METRKDILVRTYLVFIGLSVFCVAIIAKVLYIQWYEGAHWKQMADRSRLRTEEIEAERGAIYSDEGYVLSTSVPEFDIYVDYQADGLRDKKGELFYSHLDSLAAGLAMLFKDKPEAVYKKILTTGYKKGERYALLKRKISFAQYQQLKELPLVRLGRNKSGFIAEVRMKRLYPFKMMANRTIGIARDSNKVGLEKYYDEYLRGETGWRLVRYIAGGAAVPVEGADTEPVDGYDLVTTLDVGIQDAAHRALERMMVENEAVHGTCIVMEVSTGKIRAIANLGRQKDGSYWEDYNYALAASEPGSTWKLTTLMAALEDKKVSLQSVLNLEGGSWRVGSQTVYDSERHGMQAATVQQSFEKSSNVGMAKLAYHYYGHQPSKYFAHLRRWGMDTLTGIDVPGEAYPRMYKPGSRWWSNTTLPWMGFGYNLAITPMHTAMLYNAVANNGRMMKPYVVQSIRREGEVIRRFDPVVLNPAICSPEVLSQVKQCLEGVVLRGTAKRLQNDAYAIAGKTGTSLVADKGITYADKVYQSSFAGYFPADNPQYTIVVVIRNKKHAARFYGGHVAAPVFKEVADKLFASRIRKPSPIGSGNSDSVRYHYAGTKHTMQSLAQGLAITYHDRAQSGAVAHLRGMVHKSAVLAGDSCRAEWMPALKGVGLRDALELCETRGLVVSVKGRGKVSHQSIPAGVSTRPGQKIHLELE